MKHLLILGLSILSSFQVFAQINDYCAQSCSPDCLRRIEIMRNTVARSDQNCGAYVQSVICTPDINDNTRFVIRTVSNNRSIGTGFRSMSDCNYAKNSRTQNLVCAPGNYDNQKFYVRTITDDANTIGNGFSNLQDCVTGLGYDDYLTPNLVCVPGINNNNKFYLRRLDNGDTIGSGFTTVAQCALARNSRTQSLVCAPGINNVNKFFIRDLNSGNTIGGGFSNIEDCAAAL